MSTQPTLSVVVPFYGVEDYLEECLDSIAHQTFSDFQVVMVDDESPDSSAEIAQRFADRDSRFQLIRQKNVGPGPSRNNALKVAEGRFIAFADGDDIVPRRAYETMITTLNRTGSSIAVGNARRFSRTSGVRQSWSHAKAGLSTRSVEATHIFERPALAYDRMMWNKIYRASFYRDFRYEFPDMLYEDWPVALRAHLEALTVDLVHAPIYYWRERESGDSITQQYFNYGNLLDRVISAEMILDLVETGATPGVKEAAHRHLMEVDMVAFAQAFAVANDDEAHKLLGLSDRLVQRLEPPRLSEPRYNQLQYYALKQGNVAQLRALAGFRDSGGLVGGTKVRRKPLNPAKWRLDYPGRGKLDVPKNLYEIPFTALKLKTLVTSVQWLSDHTLGFEITAQIGHLSASWTDEVSVCLVNGINRTPLNTELFEATDLYSESRPVGVRFEVDLNEVRELDDLVWPLRFEVTRSSQRIRRTSMLTGAGPGSPQYPGGQFFSKTEYIQPGLTAGNAYCLHRVAFPTVVSNITSSGKTMELSGVIPDAVRTAELTVKRPDGDITTTAELESVQFGTLFRARLDCAAVVSGDSADDPFLHTANRAVRLTTEFGDLELRWSDYMGDSTVVVQDRVVSLTRSRFGLITLVHGPIIPMVERVQFDGVSMEVSGRSFGLNLQGTLTWRKYLPNSDQHVDIPLTVAMLDETFVARIEALDVIPEVDMPTQPGAPAADYTLFFTAPDYEKPLPVTPSALAQLPQEHTVSGRSVLATTAAGSARLQVR